LQLLCCVINEVGKAGEKLQNKGNDWNLVGRNVVDLKTMTLKIKTKIGG